MPEASAPGPDFWTCCQALPANTQTLASQSFELLTADPRHPSLRLKEVGQLSSVRVGLHYRALAVAVTGGLILDPDTFQV